MVTHDNTKLIDVFTIKGEMDMADIKRRPGRGGRSKYASQVKMKSASRLENQIRSLQALPSMQPRMKFGSVVNKSPIS